ncbi:hypothetical protein DFS34DRAFT_595071 [Phlyctochytrium arcticum]|nr:hypothetical protein DFS34DRAFT_595071 [Phlyctochytrium arcticum]
MTRSPTPGELPTSTPTPTNISESTPLLPPHSHLTPPRRAHMSVFYSPGPHTQPHSPPPDFAEADDENTPLIYAVPSTAHHEAYLQAYVDDDPPPYYEPIDRRDSLPTYMEIVPTETDQSETEDDDWLERWGGYIFSAFFILMFAGATLVALLPLGSSEPFDPPLPVARDVPISFTHQQQPIPSSSQTRIPRHQTAQEHLTRTNMYGPRFAAQRYPRYTHKSGPYIPPPKNWKDAISQ